jgi:ribosomal protein S18 acetylase RimI-like enzyme
VTEPTANPAVRALAKSDAGVALELSTAAGWNQTAADWEMLLRLAPDGCFGIDADGKLRATATLFSYGQRLGWIGMVLTDANYRRRGFARTLFEHVLRISDERGIECLKLDATDQGQPLYEGFGFRVEQPVERWWRSGNPDAKPLPPRPEITGEFRDMDEQAFGVDRGELLKAVAQRSAIFANADGYALLRPGIKASYTGPCVARNVESARDLMTACIVEAGAKDCFWDLLPGHHAAAELARELGFAPRRKLIRMLRGLQCGGRQNWIHAIAGFELG